MRELMAGREAGVYELIAYHLGWRDELGEAVEGCSGKLIRPSLVLIAADAFGGASSAAIDAACAVEFLHAFSLVHDDIEDGDRERRHRPTLWALAGVPHAINAGDSLFALAHRVLVDAAATIAPADALRALRVFSDACLLMIEGQHDDLAFESRSAVALDEYEAMAARKTGALIGAALAIGAIFGGASRDDTEQLRSAGLEIGLAFQGIDDALAIWGDERATGKPVRNDLARGKKSLPVVIAAGGHASPDDDAVREHCLHIAAVHADRARRLISSTGMSAGGASQLEAMIGLVLQREH